MPSVYYIGQFRHFDIVETHFDILCVHFDVLLIYFRMGHLLSEHLFHLTIQHSFWIFGIVDKEYPSHLQEFPLGLDDYYTVS